MATAGVMLSQGPQARRYTHNAVRTKGGRRFGRPISAGRLAGRTAGTYPAGGVGQIFGRNPQRRSRPADFGRPDRRRVFRPRTAAEPHRRFIPMSSTPGLFSFSAHSSPTFFVLSPIPPIFLANFSHVFHSLLTELEPLLNYILLLFLLPCVLSHIWISISQYFKGEPEHMHWT